MSVPFTVVDVVPDTARWQEERRLSVGASEVAAVMGLSRYGTALDVYKAKVGVDREFDPLLSFVGHESEPIIHKWVERFSNLPVTLEPGFMGRSISHPYLHATFDRISRDPFTTWQFKTAHQHTGHHWDEGIPTDIRVQVQAEMFVAGTDRAAVVVWIGGREFRLIWEARDDLFIQGQMLPAVTAFWAGVQLGEPPRPSTLLEAAEVWPSQDLSVEASPVAFEAVERRAVLLSDIASQQAEADALKLVLADYMMTADTLTFEGRRVLTYKTQSGRMGLDTVALKAVHPEIVADRKSVV